MLNHVEVQNLNDFFIDLDKRKQRGVYFYRIHELNEQVKEFLVKYYQAARNTGIVIEGKISNPDEKNLSYYQEIMGMSFFLDVEFFDKSLQKWLPRINAYQRGNISNAMFDTLNMLKASGKNENMLKNAYIKFMCWLYYRFERILHQLGKNTVPKILYEGNIGQYELLLIQILSKAGCDVVLLQAKEEVSYLKLIRDEIQILLQNERLYGVQASIHNATNVWITGRVLDDIKMEPHLRGSDKSFFYNAFIKISGVEDKITYANELYQFYLQLKNKNRRIVVVDNGLPIPTIEEISKIKRNKYETYEQMLVDLQVNVKYTANIELQRIMVKSFVDIFLEEKNIEGMTVNKMINKAVYVLCWLKCYQEQLFCNWKVPQTACFIYFGNCKNSNEALFLKFLARLPIDVLVLNPNRNMQCMLQDKLLYEVQYEDVLEINKFPSENTEIQLGTVAYHAERELDTLMYQNTGIYRNKQYRKAVAINLQTIYEEIFILWKQELKYRPNFSTNEECVNMPVIFAKVCGVKDGNLTDYWWSIKQLLTEDTFLIKKASYITSIVSNPIKAVSTEFFKNGKLQRNKIKNHARYQYGFLREEIQDYILDKLELLIEQRSIKGTFENGTEYTIISTVLNMDKELLRMIQKFDFTKNNPKVVYLNVTEENISLEDSILVAFLNLVGFDIVFFVPTGYQTVEKYFNKKLMDEHQIGEYLYDLSVPDFSTISSIKHMSWKNKIFRRGM